MKRVVLVALALVPSACHRKAAHAHAGPPPIVADAAIAPDVLPVPSLALANIPPGHWVGKYGTIDLRADGTSEWNVDLCFYGKYEVDPNIPPNLCHNPHLHGQAIVSLSPLAVRIPELMIDVTKDYDNSNQGGDAFSVGAYLGADKTLHLSGRVIGEAVGAVNSERRGIVQLDDGTFGLRVGGVGGGCTIEASENGATVPTRCAFKTVGRFDVLDFDYPSNPGEPPNFARSPWVPRTLVYLPAERLIVSPDMVWMSFQRKSPLPSTPGRHQ